MNDRTFTLTFTQEDLVNTEIASRILGRNEQELRKRRMFDAPPVYRKVGVRAVRYRVGDLVDFLKGEQGND